MMTCRAAMACALYWRAGQAAALLYVQARIASALPLLIGFYFAAVTQLVLVRTYAMAGI